MNFFYMTADGWVRRWYDSLCQTCSESCKNPGFPRGRKGGRKNTVSTPFENTNKCFVGVTCHTVGKYPKGFPKPISLAIAFARHKFSQQVPHNNNNLRQHHMHNTCHARAVSSGSDKTREKGSHLTAGR